MKRILSISTGCFYSINKGYNRVMEMDGVIKLCSKMDVDGVEILFGNVAELIKYKFKKETLDILRSMKFNTIHAPFYHQKKEDMIFSNKPIARKALAKIYHAYDMINAKNINFHPQQVKNFKIFDTINYQHSIENMEKHHNFDINYYNKIFKNNHSFKFVLDTTHSSEAGELNKLFKVFNKKIIYCHLSANYFNHLHLPLHVLNKEYLKQFNIIKKSRFPIVLENQTGTKTIGEYKKEVDFVRKWLN